MSSMASWKADPFRSEPSEELSLVRIAKEDAEIIRRDCGPGVIEELTNWARRRG